MKSAKIPSLKVEKNTVRDVVVRKLTNNQLVKFKKLAVEAKGMPEDLVTQGKFARDYYDIEANIPLPRLAFYVKLIKDEFDVTLSIFDFITFKPGKNGH